MRLRFQVLPFLAILLAASLPLHAQTPWTELSGPHIANPQCLVPIGSNTIALGSDRGGIFQSTDQGATWGKLTLPGRSVKRLLVRNNGDILAGLEDSLMISHDNCATWAPTKATVQNTGGIVVDESDGTIYVGSWSGVSKSTDGGNTWTDIMSGLPNVSVNDLAMNSAGVLFTGHQNMGLYTSTDKGASWTSASTELEAVSVKSIRVADASTMYIATAGMGVYKSTDAGKTWTAIINGMDKLDCSVIAVTPGDVSHVYAGTLSGRLYASTDAGSTWTQILQSQFIQAFQALLPIGGGNILAGVLWDGVYRSTDAGATWSHLNEGLVNFSSPSMARNSKGTLFVVNQSYNDILRSSDQGNTWASSAGGTSRNTRAVAVMNNDYLYAGTQKGVFHSTDDGLTWTKDLADLNVRLLVISGNRSIFAAMFGGKLYRSTDYGQNWSKLVDNLGGSDLISIVISETGVVFAGTENAGAYRSTDNGNTWTSISKGLTRMLVSSLAYHKDYGLFAGSYGEVQRSMDQGETWKRVSYDLPAGTVTAMTIAPNGVPVAGMEVRGVYYLDVNKLKWIRANEGLDNTSILCFLQEPDGSVYAGTDGNGVYRNLRVPTAVGELHASASSLSISGYPSPVSLSRNGAVMVSIRGANETAALRISVADVLGRVVYTHNARGVAAQATLPLRGLAAGSYIVSAEQNGAHARMLLLVTQ